MTRQRYNREIALYEFLGVFFSWKDEKNFSVTVVTVLQFEIGVAPLQRCSLFFLSIFKILPTFVSVNIKKDNCCTPFTKKVGQKVSPLLHLTRSIVYDLRVFNPVGSSETS